MSDVSSFDDVVERYIYDPYGRTVIASVVFYHDHDLDGDIDAADVAHYDWCTSSGFPQRAQDPMCVLVHNRDGDYALTAADGALLAAYVASEDYDSNGSPAPPEWERLRTAYLDANNDQLINLYDWYGFQVCEGVTTSTGGMNDHLCLFLYDLDGDGEVTFDEGQQGCNLFTGTWGTPGDGHPGQATGSRFGNPFKWTGQRYDAPTGLYHFLFRSYSPNLGRWLQRDPLSHQLSPEIAYPDGLNIFAYARSNPVLYIDPTGLAAIPDAVLEGLVTISGGPSTLLCATGGSGDTFLDCVGNCIASVNSEIATIVAELTTGPLLAAGTITKKKEVQLPGQLRKKSLAIRLKELLSRIGIRGKNLTKILRSIGRKGHVYGFIAEGGIQAAIQAYCFGSCGGPTGQDPNVTTGADVTPSGFQEVVPDVDV